MKKKKGVPGIYRRGNKWTINTTYKGTRIWETCATEEMAEINLRKIMTLIDEGRYLEKKQESKMTMGQFAEKYLEWCQEIGQKAVDSKTSHVEHFQKHFGKETRLCKITRGDIEKYQATLLSSPGKRKSALKTATVNRRMACLRHLFSKAKEWKIIADHPCEGVKQLRENNERTRFLDIEECTALLDACPSPTLRHIVELALNTGMRKSEILRLKWKHVNLRRDFLEILDQKNGGYSTIPLNQTLVQLFKKIPRRLDSEYVFPGTKPGNPYFDLKRQFEKAVTDAKLEGVTFHTLRHTAASHMVMNGIDLATVKEILRHKEFSTTLRYAHLSSDHKQSAVETLGTALKKSVKKSNKTA